MCFYSYQIFFQLTKKPDSFLSHAFSSKYNTSQIYKIKYNCTARNREEKDKIEPRKK